jgi:hypothetical protein
MQDTVVVGEDERGADRRQDRGGLVRIERRVLVEKVGQRRAVDVFHDQERLVGVGVPLVDRDDVRVVEHRRGARFRQPGRVAEPADARV